MFKKLTNLKIKKLPLILSTLLLLFTVTPFTAAANMLDEILWGFVNQTAGNFVGIGATFLNNAISNFVVGFGNMYNTTGLGVAINDVWGTIRDIFNLFFIFGLVYIGFKMILDSSSNTAKRALIYIFLAALLVNFSLFFSKFVVDVSNITAAQIASASDFKQKSAITGDKFAIANRFMDIFGLSKIFNSKDDSNNSPVVSGTFSSPNATGFGNIFYTLIIFLVTGFVFFAGAFLLTIRFVTLLFFIVLSPVMFIGWVFPFFESYSREYWRKFLGQAFFAPAYILMLLISIRIFEKFRNFLADKSIVGAINPSPNKSMEESVGDTVPYFIMMCGFLIGSIIVAQKIGAAGAGMAVSAGNTALKKSRQALQTTAGALTLGVAAYTAQRTVGSGANAIRESESFKKFASKNYLGTGKLANKALNYVGDASFDARNTGITGNYLGQGNKGGNTTWRKQKDKDEKAYSESLETKTRDANGDLLKDVEQEINQALKGTQQRLINEKKDTDDRLENEKVRVSALKAQEGYDGVKSESDNLKTQLDQVNETNRTLKDEIIKAQTTGDKNAELAAQKAYNDYQQTVTDAEGNYKSKKNELDKLDAKINDQTQVLSTNLKNINDELTDFNDPKKLEARTKELESEIKYQNIVGRRQDLSGPKVAVEDRNNDNWNQGYLEKTEKGNNGPIMKHINNQNAATAGAVVAGVTAAIVSAPVIPIMLAGAAAGFAANYIRRDNNNATANTILKEYGREGQNREKKQKQKNQTDAIITQLREGGLDISGNTTNTASQGSGSTTSS